MRWKNVLTRAAVAVAIAAIVGVAVAAYANAAVYQGGKPFIVAPAAVDKAQAALVLGALVFADGRVSPMVADRLETAHDLYRSGRVEKILISGDHGRVDYDEVNTMREYLERKGVPPQDIFMDHAGFDTYNSMYRAREVFAMDTAVVVTQGFHLPRALYIANRLGLQAQGVAADRHSYYGSEYYEYREMGARVKAFAEVLLRRRPVFLGPAIPISGNGLQTHDRPR